MTEPESNKEQGMGSFVSGYTMTERLNMPELSFLAYSKLVEPLAKEVEEETGILHVVPLIQSAHESRSGNSGLSKEYGNLFGFKATPGWKANGNPVADLPTWEVVNTTHPEQYKDMAPVLVEKFIHPISGKEFQKLKITIKQEFRVYPTWRESFFDWGRLISTVKLYSEAYKLLKRKETVRDGIRTMAYTYATDPNYARSLIALYDKMDSGGQ